LLIAKASTPISMLTFWRIDLRASYSVDMDVYLTSQFYVVLGIRVCGAASAFAHVQIQLEHKYIKRYSLHMKCYTILSVYKVINKKIYPRRNYSLVLAKIS